MSNNFYPCTLLTGGGAGALDAIDGTALGDGDGAMVVADGITYSYRLDATSAAGESSPRIIQPDANGGDKRWILQPPSLAFPSTAVPSGDPNTLDDYEEGTWTPILTTRGVDFTSVTYDPGTGGRYTKNGDVIHIQGYLRTDSVTVGSADTGVVIGGLPFKALTSTGATYDGKSTINMGIVQNWAGENPSAGEILAGGTEIVLSYRSTADGETLPTEVSDVSNAANVNQVIFSGTYKGEAI